MFEDNKESDQFSISAPAIYMLEESLYCTQSFNCQFTEPQEFCDVWDQKTHNIELCNKIMESFEIQRNGNF